MIDREWLECLLTSYYLFIEHFQGDPDIQVQLKSNNYIIWKLNLENGFMLKYSSFDIYERDVKC